MQVLTADKLAPVLSLESVACGCDEVKLTQAWIVAGNLDALAAPVVSWLGKRSELQSK